MFYATLDHDGERIKEGASIAKFNTLEAARDYLLSVYGDEWDRSTAKIEAGSFGDCWFKKYQGAPKVGEACFAPFSYPQLYIQRPGQHPGGKAYWVTPRPDVLVVSAISEIEE